VDHPSLAPALDILERLIAFDTRSSESNLPLIDYVRDVLGGYGIESTLIHDATGRKANLYATIGPSDRPGLCLSGHTDVVPAAGQPWTVPPFAMTRGGDRVLGRGVADMKGYLAVVLGLGMTGLSLARQQRAEDEDGVLDRGPDLLTVRAAEEVADVVRRWLPE